MKTKSHTRRKAGRQFKLKDGTVLFKECYDCGQIKRTREFPEGRNWCRKCDNRYQRAHRAKNVEYYREYDRKRNVGKRKVDGITRLRKWQKENPKKRTESKLLYDKKDLSRYKAHYTISNYLRYGKLEKEPCIFCGKENSIAHHEDYEKPLEVIWMCQKCHRFYHFGRLNIEKSTPEISP